MDNRFYLPILKSKLGEFTALSKLSLNAKKRIMPLFEITPLEWDHADRKVPRTLHEHLELFCKKYVSKWARDNCFIDGSLLNWNGKDNTHEIAFVYQILHGQNFWPVPVIHLDSTEPYINAITNTFELYGFDQIGLRLSLVSAISDDLQLEIDRILNRFEIDASHTHLILDLKDARFDEVENLKDGLLELLEPFPYLQEWKSFTVAGTAFPQSSNIKEGLWEFDRNDWKLYETLCKEVENKNWGRNFNFGDYSVVNPTYFEFDPKKMSASALIRYTHKGKWVVAKGRSLKLAGNIQYKKLAKQIYDTSCYLGEGFSPGSQYIAKCIRGEVKPGNPTTWIWVGSNQHFHKVLFDLFSILPET